MDNRRFLPVLVPSLLTLAMAASWPAAAQLSDIIGGSNSTSTTPLSDGQILEIIHTINDAEIKQAELAMDESEDAQVMQVAQMIITDHESSNDQIEALEDANDAIDLDDSDMSESIADMTEDAYEVLDDLDEAQFACAYLMKQEEQHQHGLDTVSKDLLPSTTSAEVTSFLAMTSTKMEQHLAMAKAARESLPGCG
ncbi:MAG TPA: DUF4142 domain-containing protein [Hyphomicrobiales bacterium]|nr:DUF4142 domain-containing protein [Hyphomicrobiales bacterium]